MFELLGIRESWEMRNLSLVGVGNGLRPSSRHSSPKEHGITRMGCCQKVAHIRFLGYGSTVAAVHRCTAQHTDRKLLFLLCLCQWGSRQRTWNIDSQLSKGGNTADFRHEPEMTVPRLPTQFPVSPLPSPVVPSQLRVQL